MFSFRKKKKKSIAHDPNIKGIIHAPKQSIYDSSQRFSPNEDEESSLGSMISLTPAEITNSPKLRAVKLLRGRNGKFGISLSRGGDKHFVEGPGLYPQDRLIEVNGENVEGAPDERIYELIEKGGSELTLVVQGLPEMAEINSRITPEQRDSVMSNSSASLASSEYHEEPWQQSRRVWYVTTDGFVGGTILPSTTVTNHHSSLVLIRLDNNKMIEVDEYDIEQANPHKYDRAENLATLLHINESSVLHTLRQRFGSNLIHTQAANILLLINPSRKLSVYNTKVMSMFRNMHYSKMPPHLYKTAKQAHLRMLATHMEQSIVLCGSTGSGKSTALHYIVHYYAQVHCSPKGILPSEKLTAALALLDSFGCCLSESNTHSTRFTTLFTLNFTNQGILTGAQVYTCLLDRFRVVRCEDGELGYHIFYQMIEGSDDSLRRELQLGPRVTENNAFLPSLTEHGQRKQAAENYAKTLEAFKFLGGVSIPEVKGLLTLLSAILHLGRTGAVNNPNGLGARFANPTAAQIAASVLGIKYEAFERQMLSALPLSSEVDPARLLQNAIEDLAMSLYDLAFSAVNALINRSLGGPGRSPYSLILADMPGFQNPARPASIQHLLMNYAAERLQGFFQQQTFSKVLDLFEQEEVNVNFTDIPKSPQSLIELLDRYYQGNRSSTNSNVSLEQPDSKGLFWILDEESMFPGGTDISFLGRLLRFTPDSGGYRLIHQSGPSKFVLSHCNNTINVEYDCSRWLELARDTSAARYAKTIVSESTRQPIEQLFQGKGASAITKGSPTPKSLTDGTSTFMRQANSRKGHAILSSTSVKPQNRCLNYKFQLDFVFDTLRRTNPHFIHCMTPRPTRRSMHDTAIIDIMHMRQQLRNTGILSAIRLYRQGFPDCLNFADFNRQFEVLRVTPYDHDENAEFDEREAVITILEDCELDPGSYRTGISKVFFKTGVLSRLQHEKEQKLRNFVVALQSLARGSLARMQFDKLTMKQSAVMVIQRNAAIHAELQAWSWWKLYTRVKPLIHVHSKRDMERAENELKTLKAKLTKLEEELSSVNDQNTTLNEEVDELKGQLRDERESMSQIESMYENEVVNRRSQENQFSEIKEKFEAMIKENDKLTNELNDLRKKEKESKVQKENLIINDEEENTAQFWKQKYLQATSDLDNAKRSFEAESAFAGDALKIELKQLQRRLQEMEDEKEHHEHVNSNYKRSQQKQNEEIADLKVNLEQIQSRNADLERKQKRFDQELAKVNQALKTETNVKEKLTKEKEALQTEILSMRDKIREAESIAEESKRKLVSAESQLSDMAMLESSPGEMVNLKKQKRELEQKVDDLEEELEEASSQLTTSQAAKTKWEMEAGSLRTQLVRDNEAKEEEISSLRETLTKRISSLQEQLEEEYNTSKSALKQKRELERQMADLREAAVDEEELRRVKRQLAKAKALYRDAQAQLGSRQSSSVNKTQLNSLKGQVEDLQEQLTMSQRAKRSQESEINELNDKLQTLELSKMDSDNRVHSLNKQIKDAQNRAEEAEEEVEEAERKLRQTNTELGSLKAEAASLQAQLSQQKDKITEYERQISDLQANLEKAQKNTGDKDKVVSLENRVRELESEVEFEKSQKTRQERSIKKLKESNSELQLDIESKRSTEMSLQNEVRRLQRQLKEANDLANDTEMKDVEWNKKKREYEEQIEDLQYEKSKAETQIRNLQERLDRLQSGYDDSRLSDTRLSDEDDEAFLDYQDDDDINDDFLDEDDINLDLSDDLDDTPPNRRSKYAAQEPSSRAVNGAGGGSGGPARSNRRRSRDQRTQQSITAADIAAARRFADDNR